MNRYGVEQTGLFLVLLMLWPTGAVAQEVTV